MSEIFDSIEKSHFEILNGNNNLKVRIKSAKNFIANDSLDKWAFCKQVATESFNVRTGSQSKSFFYNSGFVNILSIKNSKYRNKVIRSFLTWSKEIEYFNIVEKFNHDQNDKKRFELLVHYNQIPKEIIILENLFSKNYDEFLEGFKKEIVREVNYRNSKLINLAKSVLGTTCCVCKFNFEHAYGIHGRGFIEMHHIYPISKGERISKVDDLQPVCSNCHRMLHKGSFTLTADELTEIIKKRK